MKKAVLFFMIILTVLSFYSVLGEVDAKDFEKRSVEQSPYYDNIIIPSDDNVSAINAREFCGTLIALSDKYDANIVRSYVNYVDKTPYIINYVILNDADQYFNDFRLTTGRFLTPDETKNSVYYLSTENDNNALQIGQIADFSGNNNMVIKPFDAAFDALPVAGAYYIKSEKLDLLKKELCEKYQWEKLESSNIVTGRVSTNLVTNIYSLGINLIILSFVLYYLFNQSKKIGIMKMNGLSTFKIWWLSIGRFVSAISLFCLIASLIASQFVVNTYYGFVFAVISDLLFRLVIMMLVLIFALFLIHSMRINTLMKDGAQTKGVFKLNLTIKGAFAIFLVLISIISYNSISEIVKRRSTLDRWSKANDYGLFSLSSGDEGDDAFSDEAFNKKFIELYPTLNQAGAMLIDSSSFEPLISRISGRSLDDGQTEEERIINNSFIVNNNYLKNYPVLDLKGNPILISESDQDSILLVPEKYRTLENKIIENYEKNYGNKTAKITWTQNGQKLFSFNADVNPEDQNLVLDPIIFAITEANINSQNYPSGFGMSNVPLKIKLLENDTKKTLDDLQPALKKLQLDDNLFAIVSMNEAVNEEIYWLGAALKTEMIIFILLALGLFLVLMQSAIVFFTRYQKKFLVMKFFGIGFFRTYQLYFMITGLMFLLIFLLAAIFSSFIQIYPKITVLQVVLASLCLLLFETIVSVVSLLLIERKNIIKVLKGG